MRTASRIEIDGQPYFLKYLSSTPAGFFETEAEGLAALARAVPGEIRVPVVHSVGTDGGFSWILIDWIKARSGAADEHGRLGRGLARMHRTSADRWGWHRDGYIGPLEQGNAEMAEWSDFWWSRRLEPQLRRSGNLVKGDWQTLQNRMEGLLGPVAEEDGPSLLHGDLWGGNALFDVHGPVLIDPAVYFGHREVDLAMTDLFGGFTPEFYESYHDEWPLQSGWRTRRLVYQLFYLLVHVNLFGSAYVARTRATLSAVLQATA